ARLTTRAVMTRAEYLKLIFFIESSFLILRFRSWLPAASERAKGADRRARCALTSYGQLVLGNEQLAVRVEHVREGDDARGVGLFRQVSCTLQCGDFTNNFIAAILRLDKQAESVFDIFGGVQDGVSILNQGFGFGPLRLLHFRSDSSEIEESPAQTYYADRLKSLLFEKMGGRQGFRSDNA